MTARVDRGVLILAGPTASGKTDLAIALAERFDAEIVGADSRQIYRDMPIGTAAPTAQQLLRVPHHLIGFVDPYERYSAARYVQDAAAAIHGIHARGKRAIVAGGTGFYLRALCGEVDLAAQPDPALRARLQCEAETHPVDVLYDWLRVRDPLRAATISAHDPYRIVRALEVCLSSNIGPRRLSHASRLPTLRAAGLDYVKVILRADRAELRARIELRTHAMLAAGLIAEAERIGSAAIAADAVGYREASAYAAGWLTYAELVATLNRATRRYAKRQLTWFRAQAGVTWIESGNFEAAVHAATGIGWR